MLRNFFLTLLVWLGFVGIAWAQSEVFDDLTLDSGGAGSPFLRFYPDGDPAKFFRLWSRSTGTSLDIDGPTVNCVARIFDDADANSFSIADAGIGIGTSFPSDSLHVFAGSSTAFTNAIVVVENAQSTTQLRSMFELINNGPARFELNDTATGQTWAFQTNNSDGFLINRLGSGGNEMSIRKTGLITMGPGGKLNFVLDPAGNLTIDGALTQNSDRDKKEAFAPVDCGKVLESVARLPVTSWRYKDDPPGLRHLGPTAQDFHREFQIGKDDKSISAIDADGVSLAAIKALNDRVDQLTTSLDKAEKRIVDLEKMLLNSEQ